MTKERMTKQQELDLVAKAKAGDVRAQTAIVKKYELLCHKLARKFGFMSPSYQHEDLFQEACIGVLNAIKSYDEKFGAGFMTWAYYNIRGAVAGAGRIDQRQPKFPKSIEDADRAYNIEDLSQRPTVKEDISVELITKIIEQSCGGLHTKRANVVMDRFGLLGREALRNFECAEKYGITKYAVNSHTYQFKCKARAKFPELAEFI